MDSIDLRALTFYGYHGALPEERRLGQRFSVDVQLRLNLQPAGRNDDLTQTVNYADVADVVRTIVEGPPFALIEAVAEAVAGTILDRFARVDAVTVRVSKPSAPIPSAPTVQVAVEIERPHFGPTAPLEATAEAELAGGAVLSASAIRALLDADPPLIEPVSDPHAQIQPNGVDLTLESVWRLSGVGALGARNADRSIPDRQAVEASTDGWFELGPGTYVIRLAETVALPLNLMAFGRPRSSLLRCGAALHTAVWDAGYRGRSEALLIVYATAGLRLARGVRLLQLVFVRLDAETHAYDGAYQGENLSLRS